MVGKGLEKEKSEEDVKELANYVLEKLAKKADDAVVASNRTKNVLIKFANNKVSVTKQWIYRNMELFVSVKKRLVSTSLEAFSKSAVDKTVKEVLSFAEAVQPNEEYNGIAEGPFKYEALEDCYDPKIAGLNEASVDLVDAAITKALSLGAERSAGTLQLITSSTYLKTSNKVEAEEIGTGVYLSLRAFADATASGHAVACARMLKKIDAESVAEEAATIALDAKNPEQGPRGVMDVVFEPLPFADLINNVGFSLSAFYVDAGLSCFKGLVGKRVAEEGFTLKDNGRLANGFGSSSFDDEGVPTRETTLIKEGILKTYLHNTSTAKRHNTSTTANAGLIIPKPSNLVVPSGSYSKEELVSEVKKGLYVTNTWYTRFQNYSTGDFSTIPRDGMFLIENGELKQPVIGVRISDNLLRILKNIAAVGKDQKQVVGWEVETPTVTPPVLVRNVRITKSVH